MRFFSNEAKENADDQPLGENDQERAESDGATVPQQRIGSPWNAAPGADTNPEDSVREEAAPDSLGDEPLHRDDSEERHDGDDLVRDDNASHSDDLDLPLDDRPADSDSHSESDSYSDPASAEADSAPTSALAEEDRADDFHPGSHRADGEMDSTVATETTDTSDTSDTEDRVSEQPGAEQLSGTTTTYGPDGSMTTVDESTDTAASEPVATDTTDTDTTDAADRTDEERDLDEATPAVATAPVETTTPADSDSDTDSDSADDVAPAVAAVPVDTATTEAAKPDPSASPVGDRLFTDGDSFNDRLRDVALNFVDNPKEATEQAGALVDEAIDKVTSALKAQKDALAGEGDDTEKLRVQLRGYREILKRLTSL